ncbi:hypothetical protein KP509_33G056300 [Ceratopteris richardii]|uniref:C2H2-type domain-containing protein n=1 Tax=Ceratopteris richardii TaxID=49495 RepID=A0A8T2QRP3_CERRI|nr:hypothetical protein KP509_33G056300 [Ceratopteris richardii]KAH7286041.1 hypothetical protein KP509_33G056300 [Ceratopteris richardii]KAH7286042.1 hypothetical protein KP509_33G056300 [Ceratopteris richardii]
MSNLSTDEALPPISISSVKKKRNLPGRPDPDAEVIALSPRSLLTTNRFVCEICNKGFQRDQNLQLHRRGHNLPWRLKQKESHEYKKKVYICPEINCVHHDPARALGDLTGIKKHFFRKHGEKKYKCDKCSKRYAVQSDWKAHLKTCGTKEYRCDCGTMFSRKDSFITHRAFCDVIESGKDKKCNEETQKQVDSEEEVCDDDCFEKNTSTPVEAAASPVSQVTGELPSSSDLTKPVLPERAPDNVIAESGITSSSLSSTWMQGTINGGTSLGPGLSLSLGMDPGPGLPSGAQVACSPNASVLPFGYPSPSESSKLSFRPLAVSESQSSSIHVPSKGAMGMLASLFSSPAHRQSRDDNYLHVNSLSANDHDHHTLSAGLSNSTHDTKNNFGFSKSYMHAASAATSATALLLKAAEMGSKTSTSSMFQGYGMDARDPCFQRSVQGIQSSFQARQQEHILRTHESQVSKSPPSRNGSTHADVSYLAPLQINSSGGSSSFLRCKMTDQGNYSILHSNWSSRDSLGYPQQNCLGYQKGQGEKEMVDFLGVAGSAGQKMGRNTTEVPPMLLHRNLESIAPLTGVKLQQNFPKPGSGIG